MKIKPTRGFTLLEVMIALTIFAAIAMVVSGTTSQSTDTLLQLENKTIASWVAENRIAALRTVIPAPETGDSDDEVTMANRTWRLHTKVEKTQFNGVVRVTVSVAEENQPDYPLVSLVTILGNY
ncbi:type II secretion system minor pseudopilin GspI [Parathalassolituus penaei]|uniref:Type II secretion system protein I n=1 Tax=Parathalassolituus penaei TaxID=2997323 RepID=A0A9X3EEW6_9GAMM|nr:type II secretion system minor pseudopilin GspI [Parathalassolituus penaei]MCY0965494.1 type II secretion system minor pseudopilin GspI [Parathalassolituus penaei]